MQLHSCPVCSVLQCVAVCCRVLQCVEVCCVYVDATSLLSCMYMGAILQDDNMPQHTATHCNTLQHNATYCNTLHQPVLRVCRCILTGVLYLCGSNYARCSVFVRPSCMLVHTRHSLQSASVFMRRCCIFMHRIHSLHVKDSILLSCL